MGQPSGDPGPASTGEGPSLRAAHRQTHAAAIPRSSILTCPQERGGGRREAAAPHPSTRSGRAPAWGGQAALHTHTRTHTHSTININTQLSPRLCPALLQGRTPLSPQLPGRPRTLPAARGGGRGVAGSASLLVPWGARGIEPRVRAGRRPRWGGRGCPGRGCGHRPAGAGPERTERTAQDGREQQRGAGRQARRPGRGGRAGGD